MGIAKRTGSICDDEPIRSLLSLFRAAFGEATGGEVAEEGAMDEGVGSIGMGTVSGLVDFGCRIPTDQVSKR